MREEERDQEAGIHRIFCSEYDGSGNLIKRLDQSIKGEDKSRIFQYDGKGRLTHLMDEAGGVTRLFYDGNNRIVKTVRPEQYNPQSDDGAGVMYQYDSDDHVAEITGPDRMPLQTYSYDQAGNLKSVLEGNHVYTEYAYNLAGDLTVIYKGQTNAQKGEAAQRFTYDAQGIITGVEDGNQNQTAGVGEV